MDTTASSSEGWRPFSGEMRHGHGSALDLALPSIQASVVWPGMLLGREISSFSSVREGFEEVFRLSCNLVGWILAGFCLAATASKREPRQGCSHPTFMLLDEAAQGAYMAPATPVPISHVHTYRGIHTETYLKNIGLAKIDSYRALKGVANRSSQDMTR